MHLSPSRAIAQPLDTAIASVAADRIAQLSRGLSRKQVAMVVYGALTSLKGLKRDVMPSYDDWDALFYSVWYQPGHINLAYTLAKWIPEEINPLLSGEGILHVLDFGCGQLAMQFGLALAATDALREHGTIPQISVISHDPSASMRDIGSEIWDRFRDEIADESKFPYLSELREVCNELKFVNQRSHIATSWLTALHVTYKENFDEVTKQIDKRVQYLEPDLVLNTTHTHWENTRIAYSPGPSVSEYYEKLPEKTLTKPWDYEFSLYFEKTTAFRKNLYHEKIDVEPDLLSHHEKALVQRYLTYYPTEWAPPSLRAQCFFYLRK